MSLSAQETTRVIERTVKDVMHKHVLPEVLKQIERQAAEQMVNAVKYVYAAEIRKTSREIAKELADKIKITVEVIE